ncbi:MAG: triose-phosphate isomerase [Planctomycetes bacterium]|nr:triose-phosphate isomerase [Planctomycetota bacterium]
MRSTIVAGNWKLNPPRSQGEALFRDVSIGVADRRLDGSVIQAAIFPPVPYLGGWSAVGDAGSSALRLGAQDVASESWGAFTGAVGAELLRDFGVSWVLIGHSERRHHFGDTDAICRGKLEAVRGAGLVPMLCVGETEAERDANETYDVVQRQLDHGLVDALVDEHFAIAYEPVWAIGTGRTATPEQAADVHRSIRASLRSRFGDPCAMRTPILYGGSVKPDNAAALLSDPDIDGALVGGASLQASSFLAILDAAVSAVGH